MMIKDKYYLALVNLKTSEPLMIGFSCGTYFEAVKQKIKETKIKGIIKRIIKL